MRKLAWFAGAFSAGIFLAQYVLPLDRQLIVATVCLLLGVIALWLPDRWRRRGVLAGAALAMALGYNWLYARQVQVPMEAAAGSERAVVMTLCDYALPTDYGAKATVRVEGLPGKALYYGDEVLLACMPGQTVSGGVSLQSAARIRDEDVTSFTSKGVFLLAYQRGTMTVGKGSMESPRWWPLRLGRAMQERIDRLFTGDAAAFMTAILTGDKSGLSTAAFANLSEAGLVHILAVSGMHCGFLLTLMVLLLGRHRRRLLALCTIPLLLFYALLTGGTPSVVRACVMMSLLLAAPLFHRDSDGVTSLCTSLFLILVTNPFAAASISLQLSFGAMAGMLLVTPRLYRLLSGGRKHGKVFRFTASGLSATIGALVLTLPLSGLYFGTVVLVSPLSNLLCLWAASVVFISGLAAVAVSVFLMPLAALLAVIPQVLTLYILLAADWLAQLPYHALHTSNPYLAGTLALVYGLLGLAWFRREKRAGILAAGLSVVSLAVCVLLGAARYQSDLDIVMLDVGQGQSVVLKSGDTFLLADCGSANSWYDPGETAVGQLRTMGCKTLDYLLLTHYDEDHLNGVPDLLARMKVKTLLVPEGAHALTALAASSGTEVRIVREVERLPVGTAEWVIFPPLGEGEDNERGLSLLASAGEQDFLLTGDMSGAMERRLLATWPLPDVEVLAAGHHGAKSSTSEALLEGVRPELVCISVGPNSYGHPTVETLWRLKESHCTVYRTDLHGDIHLSLNGGQGHGIRQ